MNLPTQVTVDGVVVATTRHVDLAALEAGVDTLGGPPSVARLRAAIILLEGMTDDTLVDATADVRATLIRLLDGVDDGIV
jgi:hypothetical protein